MCHCGVHYLGNGAASLSQTVTQKQACAEKKGTILRRDNIQFGFYLLSAGCGGVSSPGLSDDDGAVDENSLCRFLPVYIHVCVPSMRVHVHVTPPLMCISSLATQGRAVTTRQMGARVKRGTACKHVIVKSLWCALFR